MPRVSNRLYLDRRRFLAKAWTDFQQLLKHRDRITKQHPELPAQAGKAFNRLYRAFRIAFEHAGGDHQRFNAALLQLTDPRAKSSSTHGKRRISVTALAHPEPDLKLFAKALIELAREQARKEAA